MSTKRDKGFKKVKTVKPGKKIKITKMKKKSFKFGKTYYIKITPKTKIVKNILEISTGKLLNKVVDKITIVSAAL